MKYLYSDEDVESKRRETYSQNRPNNEDISLAKEPDPGSKKKSFKITDR